MAISSPIDTTTDVYAPLRRYEYGWRYVERDLGGGNFTTEEVPLTLEDVLYPEEGDQVTHSTAHQRIVHYLVDALKAALASDQSAVVLDDIRVAWDDDELRPNGPDIAVILGVREPRNWSTFSVEDEGVRPALIIEVTSPETRGIDLVTKVDIFAEAGVPNYIVIDVRQRQRRVSIRLIGHVLAEAGYQIVAPNERGQVRLAPLDLWVGVEDNDIYCYDGAGRRVLDYVDLEAARASA